MFSQISVNRLMGFHMNVLTSVSKMHVRIPGTVLILLVIVTQAQLVSFVNSRLAVRNQQSVLMVELVSIYRAMIGKKLSIHFFADASLIFITATAARKNYVHQSYVSMVARVKMSIQLVATVSMVILANNVKILTFQVDNQTLIEANALVCTFK